MQTESVPLAEQIAAVKFWRDYWKGRGRVGEPYLPPIHAILATLEQHERAVAALNSAVDTMETTVKRMERWTKQQLPPNGGHYSHHELDGAIQAGRAALDAAQETERE